MRAAGSALVHAGRSHRAHVASALAARYGARAVVLTDSGTSALVMALRVTAHEGGTVAFPAYCCIDLTAAAIRARVQVRLYDLDPTTLSPDLESVERVLARGVDAIVVAHLYGYPADVASVSVLAERAGVHVIEDAAQGSGGTLDGKVLGAFGPLTVLSFGRGKGVTGGGGGALLATRPEWATRVSALQPTLDHGGAGWREVVAAGAQWVFGRPSLYGIPASIPALRLGEMVYHPAHEPRAMSIAAAAIVRDAIAGADAEVARRQRRARELAASIGDANGLRVVTPIARGRSGHLRLPVIDFAGRESDPRFGILRGYPRTLAEQEELRPCLCEGEIGPRGAALLGRSLFTVPTHGLVSGRDVAGVHAWCRALGARYGPGRVAAEGELNHA
ncbi:MAG TPA: DegT/DnrJ/EryC1/StrS family aminotransferase [Gemmatimonadaceae bacterium]|nr:DegT/DnrJ/EryC1/StrS family aminotransferase [Gemmatimonadaceae bacterium]